MVTGAATKMLAKVPLWARVVTTKEGKVLQLFDADNIPTIADKNPKPLHEIPVHELVGSGDIFYDENEKEYCHNKAGMKITRNGTLSITLDNSWDADVDMSNEFWDKILNDWHDHIRNIKRVKIEFPIRPPP